MQQNLTLDLIKAILHSLPRTLADLNQLGLYPTSAAPNWSVAHLPGERWYRRLRIFDRGEGPLSFLFCEPTGAHSSADIEAALAPLPFIPDLESAQLDTPPGRVFVANRQGEGSGKGRGVRLRLELDGERVTQMVLEILPSTEDCSAAAEVLCL